MAHVERRAHGLRRPGQRLQYVFRALVGELLREVVVVNAEGQPRGRAACRRCASSTSRRRVAGDVSRAEQLRRSEWHLDFGVILNGRRVIRDAADTGLVEHEPAPRGRSRPSGCDSSMNSPRDISISSIRRAGQLQRPSRPSKGCDSCTCRCRYRRALPRRPPAARRRARPQRLRERLRRRIISRLLHGRQRPRRNVRVHQPIAHRIASKIHLLHIRPVPILHRMAERGIEHAALAVHLGPGDGKVAVGAMHVLVRQIELVRIEAHQHPQLVARVVPHLIDLVAQHERLRATAAMPGNAGSSTMIGASNVPHGCWSK